ASFPLPPLFRANMNSRTACRCKQRPFHSCPTGVVSAPLGGRISGTPNRKSNKPSHRAHVRSECVSMHSNRGAVLKPTDTAAPDYFHKVVDCQWACPAHTPVPEYIRLISAGRYSDAYMVNRESNVFPGILGRTCDRPCEPACRRSRVEESAGGKPEPVAICRLKRVAA